LLLKFNFFSFIIEPITAALEGGVENFDILFGFENLLFTFGTASFKLYIKSQSAYSLFVLLFLAVLILG